MRNNKTRELPKNGQVNTHEDSEVESWAEKFGVSKLQVKKAVAKAGNSSQAVRNELSRTVPLRAASAPPPR